jgi:hypothetical protein
MKNGIEFEDYFQKNIQSGKEKITIVLGSCFHNFKNETKNLLNSWELLLQNLDEQVFLSNNYILDFEKIILSNKSKKQANEVEKDLLKCIAKKIKSEQSKLSEKDLKNYYYQIFNPNYVSDIIVLNFDSIVEVLCKKFLNCKISEIKYVPIDPKKSINTKIHQTTKFREIIFPNSQIIRLWYPHGSISKPTEIILGAKNYANHIINIERLRRHSKTEERKNIKLNTWYDQLIHQTVLILGASISDTEWDLWSVFVNRERNFSKKKNMKYRKPVFQMRNLNNDSNNNNSKSNELWFDPLFDESTPFDTQWDKLSNLLEQ